MSHNAQRKEKKRLKRQNKKAAHRRALAVSPYKRIAEIGAIHACYINAHWKESGLASLQVIRENPRGGYAMAFYLIDLWCAGLKDIGGNLDMGRQDLDFNLKRGRENMDLVRIDIEIARRLVAGGIRFARRNGFRLPPKLDRWINFLGDIGDVEKADLADFTKDGKLLWAGSMDDLARRLFHCTVDDFVRRPDVDFISEAIGLNGFEPLDQDPLDDDEDDLAANDELGDDAENQEVISTSSELNLSAEETRQFVNDVAMEIVSGVHQTLAQRNALPSPLIFPIARSMVAISLVRALEADTEDGSPQTDSQIAADPGRVVPGITADAEALDAILDELEQEMGIDPRTTKTLPPEFEAAYKQMVEATPGLNASATGEKSPG